MKIIYILVLIGLIIGIFGLGSSQDFVKRSAVQLSGVDPSVFDMNTMFMNEDEWFMDMTMDSWTPSIKAFMKDNPEDGKGLGDQALKHAYLGSIWIQKNQKDNGIILYPIENKE
jgi:hypothetical protein